MIIQPNIFRTCPDCGCNVSCSFPYLAKPNDYFSAEITDLETILQSNVIVNPGFDTDLTGWDQTSTAKGTWSWNTGHCYTNAASTSEMIYQHANFNLTCKSVIKFYHSAITGHTTLNVYLRIGGSYVLQTTLTNESAGYSYIVTTSTVTNIGFETTNANENPVWIDNIYVQEVCPTAFSVVNCCNNSIVDTLDNSDFTLYSDHAEIKFRWSKYGSNGSELKVCFNQQVIKNGTFDVDLTNWDQILVPGTTADATWIYNLGKAKVTVDTTNPYSKNLRQLIYLEKGCSYVLTFTAVFTLGDDLSLDFHTFLDDLTLDNTTSVIVGSTLNLSFTFTPDYTGFQYLNFYATYTAGVAISNFIVTLDNISISTNVCSPCYRINEHDCSLLIEATNNEDAYGLSSDYYGSMRIEGRMHKIQPQAVENVYRDSIGSFSNPMTNFAFLYELETFLLHSDQILALILLLSFDNVQIDKQYYVKKEENIEINWDNRKEYGSFKVNIYPKEQWLEKVT